MRIDFSMIEAMLWTMAKPLLAAQLGESPQPLGNYSAEFSPHGVYPCAGNDDWIAIVVTSDAEWRDLCALIPSLSALAGVELNERLKLGSKIDARIADWTRTKAATEAAAILVRAGIPAATLATSIDLVEDPHLRQRGFWHAYGTGVLPGFPWRATFGWKSGEAPGLGADTEAVLQEILDLSPENIAALRQSGAIG